MEIAISLLLSAVLIGFPTWLIVRTYKKADENTTIYPPEEVTKRLRKGFFLSNWGLEFAFGSVLSFALMFCNVNIVFQFAVPIGSVIVGLILFFIGRIQVGLMTRYINFCNRDRTELEEWFSDRMRGIESVSMHANEINTISRLTPGVTDDILSAIHSKDIITGFMAVGRIYTGNHILKNHWPIISIVLTILISFLITIMK